MRAETEFSLKRKPEFHLFNCWLKLAPKGRRLRICQIKQQQLMSALQISWAHSLKLFCLSLCVWLFFGLCYGLSAWCCKEGIWKEAGHSDLCIKHSHDSALWLGENLYKSIATFLPLRKKRTKCQYQYLKSFKLSTVYLTIFSILSKSMTSWKTLRLPGETNASFLQIPFEVPYRIWRPLNKGNKLATQYWNLTFY